MIYFLLDSGSKALKIGCSNNPDDRLAQFQTGNPNPLFLLASIEGDEETERSLHARFARYRINGEWFESASELMWFIRRASWGAEKIQEPSRRVTPIEERSSGVRAVSWLEERFRERKEWPSDELRTMAKESGISVYALFSSPESQQLPIAKRKVCAPDGRQYWKWIASDGWPLTNSDQPI